MSNQPFAPLPSPEEMSRWDAAAVEEAGVPAALLMENAGKAALDALLKEFGNLHGKRILIFMGKGNNGGDGSVLARLALNAGAEVLVCHLHPLPEVNLEDVRAPYAAPSGIGANALHIALARAAGVEFFPLARAFSPFPEPYWEHPDIVVDALLGTGLKGALRDEHAALVKRINLFRNLRPANCAGGCSCNTAASDAQWPGLAWPVSETSDTSPSRPATEPFVLSLDIPSGLNGVSGRPLPSAVAAHATITFEAPKPGLLAPEARPYLGKLLVAPVGIPKAIKQRYPVGLALLMPDCVAVTPNPYTFQHKNMAGKVLIVGGSTGMAGAPYLAALGAFRAGAGRVAVACPAGLENQIRAALPDLLTIPLGNGGEWTAEAAAELTPLLKNWNSVVLGPGLGTGEGATAVVSACLNASERGPVLADADALTIISQNRELFTALTWRDLLTPHPGEAARLLGTNTAAVLADRTASLNSLLRLTRATVVFKGPTTLIGQAGRMALSPFIEPNLALAGSGDVLAGIGGAFLALGIPAFDVACAAVYLHGTGGRLLHKTFPFRGNLPSEIAEIIPEARVALSRVAADWVPDLSESPDVF